LCAGVASSAESEVNTFVTQQQEDVYFVFNFCLWVYMYIKPIEELERVTGEPECTVCCYVKLN